MIQERERTLSALSVKIQHEDLTILGTGYIYYTPLLKDKVYVFTAAHCLYTDRDQFKEPLAKIVLGVYNPQQKTYINLTHKIDYNFVSPIVDKDVAVLVLTKSEIKNIIGNIPELPAVCERRSVSSFIAKGFPNATKGVEIATIRPVWVQELIDVHKFQIQLNEDYTDWGVDGFSGSGIFLQTHSQIYLYGIFTRYRADGKGKIIYCQYLDTINEILDKNFCPLIQFTFLGEHGLTPEFFEDHIQIAIDNLGPRFDKNLNFRMPIVNNFNELAKDNIVKKRFLDCFDNWLLGAKGGYSSQQANPILNDFENEYLELKKHVLEWVEGSPWRIEDSIIINPIVSKIEEFASKTETERDKLYELQTEQRIKDGDKVKEYSYRVPFENEIYRLRHVNDNNYKFLDDLAAININLLNQPLLIIHGEAGCGKSHLLGDISRDRIRKGMPTLLLLGQLFNASSTIWQNILSQLNVDCSKDELLSELNSIGKQKGSRVLLLFDALNEGAGKALWPNQLAGFITELSKYQYLGAVFTVRSTYYASIIPENIKTSNFVTKIEHRGFKGNEYEALRLFCEHYGLIQPSFPILTPEFTKPLFLFLICEGLKSSGSKQFPQGFHGVTGLFTYYINAIGKRLTEKRDEYSLKPWLSKSAIEEFAKAYFNEENKHLSLEKTVQLFESKFPAHKHLLQDLIQESVFIQSTYKDYTTKIESEVIYFAYERFGDFFIAEQLLLPFNSPTEIKEAFKKENQLGQLIKEMLWSSRGLIEAFSIILPEKSNLEIFEVYDWVFKTKNKDLMGNTDEWLNSYLINSLKWRSPQKIDGQKLTQWFNSKYFKIDHNELIYALFEVTAVHNHPFNSDKLHEILNRNTMPKRDSLWQQHLYSYYGKNDNGDSFPLNRLIDWAWLPNISEKVDNETVRLASQTLIWTLASTNVSLRDRATKALVNLLEEQPDILILSLKTFKDCDDPYITERLYAIAYGCTLRTSKDESIAKIAQCVYDTIFKNNNPPTHVLLRDYARNIVEFAIYKQLGLHIDETLIRPPYNSKMPEKMPTKEEVERYNLDHTSEDYKKNYGYMHNRIHYSVMTWDFGRYTVKSALRSFGAVSFTLEQEYKKFIAGLTRKQKGLMKSYFIMHGYSYDFKGENDKLKRKMGEKEYYEFRVINERAIEVCKNELKENLNDEQFEFLMTKGNSYLTSLKRKEEYFTDEIFKTPVLSWITNRAYSLGYDSKIHGHYDSITDNYNNRSDQKIERIGKKYQWIALYEIIAMISDNYKMKEDYKGKKYDYFKGPWQMYLRNINPSFITPNPEIERETEIDELGILEPISGWWFDTQYNYWDQPDTQWISNSNDLPDVGNIILRKDEKGQEWVYLCTRIEWEEPKPIGKDRYSVKKKRIWYSIKSHLVKTQNKSDVIKKFHNKDLWNTGIHEDGSAGSLINREKYWSPSFKELHIKEKTQITPAKHIDTTTNAVGEISNDKSGAHKIYKMPCQIIFDGLNLQYDKKDGNFNDKNGELIVININDDGVLIKKDRLDDFLKSKNLEIIWTILGEKSSTNLSFENNHFAHISGVYHLDEKKELKGAVTLFQDR